MDLYNLADIATMDNMCDVWEQYTTKLAAILYNKKFAEVISSDIYDTGDEYYHVLRADLEAEALNMARGISYYRCVEILKTISLIDNQALTMIIDCVEHHTDDIFSVDTLNLLINSIDKYKCLCDAPDNIEDTIKFARDLMSA